jgi:hypothetical protein
MPDSTLSQELKQPKLLGQVRQYLRLHHYAIHTERSYVDWIVRSRDDLFSAEPKIEAFLTHLAVEGNVAPATQNQAMNALVFLYRRVFRQSMKGSINAVRADKKVNVAGTECQVLLTTSAFDLSVPPSRPRGEARSGGNGVKSWVLNRRSTCRPSTIHPP